MVAPAVSERPLRDGPPDTGGPSLTGRALLALAFLFGFYVLALAVVAALVGANVAIYAFTGQVYVQLVILALFVAGSILHAAFFIARSDSASLPGVEIDEQSQPELVSLVRSVARSIDTEPPARILLVPEVNAAVTQSGGLLGLRHGERVMVIGVPLIEALTVDQLRGVVAHELGHYAGGDTRLGALTYRAGASIYRTVDNLGQQNLLGRLFHVYGRQYLALSMKVRRRQELSADAAAVRLAGRENHMTALRRIRVTSFAFDHFVRHYLGPLWAKDCDAENAFDGYRALLAEPTREEELAELEVEAHGTQTDRYDSHPALAERLAHAARAPEGPSAGQDPRPARTLLAGAEDIERRVGALLTRQMTGRTMERRLPWDASAAELLAADLRDGADLLLRAAGTVLGDPDEATLASAVLLVESGRADELAAAITGPLEQANPSERAGLRRAVLRHHLAGAIGSYLATERGHTWAVSWSGPLGLIDGKGTAKDPFAMADALLDDPSSGGRLRRSLGGVTRLSAFRSAAAGQTEPEAAAPSVVHVMTDVFARRRQFDLLVTTSALVLHPVPTGVGAFLRRGLAAQGVRGPAAEATRRRLDALLSLPVAELLGGATGAIVLAFDDMQQMGRRHGWVAEIHVAGEPKPWRLQFSSKKARDSLLLAMREPVLAYLAAARQDAA